MPIVTPRRPAESPPSGVYERLSALIVSGRIAPGTRLVETEIARRLEVSRTPIREAMRRLTHEGLAHVIGSGAKTHIAVSPATQADLIDLFGIIGALEGVAGRGVVELARPVRRSLATALADQNAMFAKAARAQPRDFDRFFAAHDGFHTVLVDRCATERLRQLIEGVRPQIKRYELLYASAVGQDFSESLAEHRAIISAVRSGTADAVERAIRRNWSNSARRLSSGLGAVTALGDYRA
jgi:DNA-binding GntR family transcriptional regulator